MVFTSYFSVQKSSLALLNSIVNLIEKTTLPSLVFHFQNYCVWPKKYYRYLVLLATKNNQDPCSHVYQKCKEALGNILKKICERLGHLGEYGKTLRALIDKQIDFICPQVKKSNFFANYSPQELDKQLIRINDFHQNYPKILPNQSKYKLSPKYENNLFLIELEERMKVFYTFKRVYNQQKNSNEFIEFEDINYLLTPEFRDNNRFVDNKCLRCSTYFIRNSIGVYDPNISFYPVDSYELNSYSNMSSIENNVRASIVAMLNNPSGGIILLGCEKLGTSVISKGLYITQKQKDSLQQKIQSYFDKIIPKVKRNQQIFLDFVPVKDKKSLYHGTELQYEHSNGWYVCRIFMLPQDNYKVYLLKSSAEYSSLETRKNNESKTIHDSQQYEYLIEKFESQYDRQQRYGLINSHYRIKCCSPEIGSQAFEKTIQPQKNEKNVYEQIKQEVSIKQKKVEKLSAEELEQKKLQTFKYWTLVVGDKSAMNKMLDAANEKQTKNIKIRQLFSQMKFKLLKTTWVMFHDQKFQNMKKIAQKHGVQYKNKQIKMIASNLYLQVQDGIDGLHYQQLYEKLIYYTNCKIINVVVKENQGKNCWVIWFENLKGSIFSYFYLFDLNYKVKFIRGASLFKDTLNSSYTAATESTETSQLNQSVQYQSNQNNYLQNNQNQQGYQYQQNYGQQYYYQGYGQNSPYYYNGYNGYNGYEYNYYNGQQK